MSAYDETTKALEDVVAQFKEITASLEPSQFLEVFEGDWSARDISAHLIGWNREMIVGFRLLRTGELPAYYSDYENDFSNVNKASVQLYDYQEIESMLDELEVSYLALSNYLLTITPEQFSDDAGVQFKDQPITIEGELRALINDYIQHTEQIKSQLLA